MKKNVCVMSRKEAVEYCKICHDVDSIIISISDPCESYEENVFVSNCNKVVGILHLYFHDLDEQVYDEKGNELVKLMSDMDALRIREFIESNYSVDTIIVHCDGGISRSAGVAAGIMFVYNGNDNEIFDNPRFCPNMHCYRTVIKAFGSTFSEWVESNINGFLMCNNCKDCFIQEDWLIYNKWSYCASCGARMRYIKK